MLSHALKISLQLFLKKKLVQRIYSQKKKKKYSVKIKEVTFSRAKTGTFSFKSSLVD